MTFTTAQLVLLKDLIDEDVECIVDYVKEQNDKEMLRVAMERLVLLSDIMTELGFATDWEELMAQIGGKDL